MKKILYAFFLILNINAFSQANIPVRVEFSEKINNENFEKKEIWLMSESFFIIKYFITPVSIKKCITELEEILLINSLSFEKPSKDLSVLASYVSGFKDYQMLSTSLKIEDSEIKLIWLTKNKNTISLNCDKNECRILISR